MNTSKSETMPAPKPPEPRIYTLGPPLSEEQVAVTFAMTSRNPRPFSEIANEVSQTSAADFHEKWVIGYGHASVAEHAVIHVAIENHSRLAVDRLEASRLASYTEKSSRYQHIGNGQYYIPQELDAIPSLKAKYVSAMQKLCNAYQQASAKLTEHLALQGSATGSTRRIQSRALDIARSLLPAATLTNVGVTANARTLAHICAKLLSDPLIETQCLGQGIKQAAVAEAPTLLKYAEPAKYLNRQSPRYAPPLPYVRREPTDGSTVLIDAPPEAAIQLTAMLLLHNEPAGWKETYAKAEAMYPEEREAVMKSRIRDITAHDALPRAAETVNFRFESIMDYGATREFLRHRMLSPFPQTPTVNLGYIMPQSVINAGLSETWQDAMRTAEALYADLADTMPATAGYAVTHGHHQRTVWQANLRELAELLRLRTGRNAHPHLRGPMQAAGDAVRKQCPELGIMLNAKQS